jgi:hypothetical protein
LRRDSDWYHSCFFIRLCRHATHDISFHFSITRFHPGSAIAALHLWLPLKRSRNIRRRAGKALADGYRPQTGDTRPRSRSSYDAVANHGVSRYKHRPVQRTQSWRQCFLHTHRNEIHQFSGDAINEDSTAQMRAGLLHFHRPFKRAECSVYGEVVDGWPGRGVMLNPQMRGTNVPKNMCYITGGLFLPCFMPTRIICDSRWLF